MRNILIRADSSSTIGTGHIMRDLVLAKREFQDCRVLFAVRDLPGNINDTIKKAGYETVELESNGIEELSAVVKEYDADTVVIDHYEIDEAAERKLKKLTGATIFVLDDTYEKHYCDILLNHNVYADPKRYESLVPKRCEIRCGREFTLLRDEFAEAKKRKAYRPLPMTRHTKLQALVAMGGADHSNKNMEILEILEKFEDIHAHVVTTRANRNIDELKSYAAYKKNVTLHIDCNRVAELMAHSDFAIVTPSVTLNEVIFMELPFIAIQTADNQKEMADYLISGGYPVLKKFDQYLLSNEIKAMADSLRPMLIDFTKLTENEKRVVLSWRNHPEVRKWMFNKNEIPLYEHLDFIESLKKRADRLYYLVKKRKESIGVVDFTDIDYEKKRAHIGLYTDPSLKGTGKILMETIIRHAFEKMRLKTLIAEVLEENKRAVALYRKFGFKEIEKERQVIRMELKNENRRI